jgi:hypothetical protein
MKNMVTLLSWESGSHLYEPQKLEVYHHTIKLEHETVKMARVDQGLQAGSALLAGKGKCSCGHTESQGSLQLFAKCTSYGRRV